MANAGFNAATDIFGLGENWKVKSATLNASGSTAECKNSLGDVTHRDHYGDRIAPSAEYEIAGEVTSLPALGKVIDVDGRKVCLSQITITTRAGAAATVSVSGVQVEDGATTLRTYACPGVKITTRHRAQDATGDLGATAPATLTEATFTFQVDVTLAEPKGEICASDVSNGRYEASYTHAVGDATEIAAPECTGSKVVSSPVSKSSPENDYVTYSYSVTDTLTGTDA